MISTGRIWSRRSKPPRRRQPQSVQLAQRRRVECALLFPIAAGLDHVAEALLLPLRRLQQLKIQRFDLKYATGPMPHGQLVEAISLYGSKVIPMVKDILSAA